LYYLENSQSRLLKTIAVPCPQMKEDKTKLIILIKRLEKYFYWYLISKDKNYIDKFFSMSKKVIRIIKNTS